MGPGRSCVFPFDEVCCECYLFGRDSYDYAVFFLEFAEVVEFVILGMFIDLGLGVVGFVSEAADSLADGLCGKWPHERVELAIFYSEEL